ncbi:NADP-dependent oxidoreductase [Streptomyces sp. R21]|uniref:NADP-dependent oxidoreductase n=1 Tax=Streptomyces sp. R21 TaxID=3238627 RepID=A0AB39P861_9ACTN
MRAIRQLAVGGPEVLELVEVERPSPGPGEVLVRVRAAGVNPADWKIRAGTARRIVEPPFTPGLDLAGVVAEVGAEVTGLRPGDRVYGMVFPPHGAQAEYVTVPADALAPVPPSVDLVQAAALPTAGLTAWQSLVRTAEVRSGQRVLIHAAAGGVGHLAVQIAKAHGAYVIGTARAAKHGFLRDLGADELIDYTVTDFTTAVRDVDIVLDPIADDYGPRSLTVLSPGGLLVDVRGTGPDRTAVRAQAEQQGLRFVEFGVTPSVSDLADIVALAACGGLRVAVEQVLPLADVAKAHELSESGRVRGKIVLEVP